MDGVESDCSESYFSAYEQDESFKPPKLECVTVVSAEELEKPLTEQQSDEQGTRGGETTTLEEEEGIRAGCTSLISKGSFYRRPICIFIWLSFVPFKKAQHK